MYTAEEYRNVMIGVITMAIYEEEKVLDHILQDTRKPIGTVEYQEGIIAGLKEAKRKLEVSEFLTQNKKERGLTNEEAELR